MFRRGSFRPYLPGVLILLSGVVLSFAGFFGAKRSEDAALRSEFALASEARLSALRRELEANLAALSSIRGFAEVTPRQAESFNTFVQHTLEGYSSIRAVEWAPKILRSERASFENNLGRPIRHGRPPSPLFPAPSSDQYFPIRFLYPLTAENSVVLGYDIGGNAAFAADILRARKTGKATVGRRLRMAEQTADGHGIPVLLPVFAGGMDGQSEAFSGFILGIMQLADVVENGLRYVDPRGIHIGLVDEDAPKGSRLLYFHTSRLSPNSKRPANENDLLNSATLRYTSQVTLGGRTWLFVCVPSEQFLTRTLTWKPWGILAGGFFVTLALTAYFLLGRVHMFRIESLVEELKQTNEKMNLEIAERKAMERNLATARDQALESSRLKSQFLANMSHEIRTPMNGVIGMTDLLLDTSLDIDQREMAHTVQTSAEALLQIIDDILDLSRIEAGKMSLENIQFQPRKTIDDVMRLLSVRANSKGLHIGCMIEPDVPETVVGDPVRVAQVLTNLVGNAIKFTEDGLITVALRADLDITGLFLRFEVKDTGIGIADDQKLTLFQPFSQGDGSMKRRFGGTGLGLAICKDLVQRMGGEIHVSSSRGAGSTFWFTVLVERAAVAASPKTDA